MDLVAIAREFPTEEDCRNFLERIRWPDGIRCPNPDYCPSTRISRFTARGSFRGSTRPGGGASAVPQGMRHLFECMECGYQFSVTTGTLFHGTHLPLQKWFFAIALMLNAKCGISTRRMKTELNVSQKTAWLLTRRIREALSELCDGEPSRGSPEA